MAYKLPVLVAQSCLTLCNPMDSSSSPPASSVHGILQAGILGWVPILQGIFPTQASNPGLLHCRQILYRLSHQGSANMAQCSMQGFLKAGQLLARMTRFTLPCLIIYRVSCTPAHTFSTYHNQLEPRVDLTPMAFLSFLLPLSSFLKSWMASD